MDSDAKKKKIALHHAFISIVMIALLAMACRVGADVIPETGIEVQPQVEERQAVTPEMLETQIALPTATVASVPEGAAEAAPEITPGDLTGLYTNLRPGVVSIFTVIQQGGLEGQAAGSGFLIDDQGHIVTNNHVVAGADTVFVVFYNGIEAEAEVIGADDDSDLAVIRVEELPEGVTPLPLGDSDQVEVGNWVIAIGNPFGVGTSMSIGIVSAVERAIPSEVTPYEIPLAIQTDAAINPGNSGGPLINMAGQVIGVNAQIATGGARASSGVGFAIPVNIVRLVSPALIQQGQYVWPYLGMEGTSVSLPLQREENLAVAQGAFVARVTPGGPADEAGLQSGDVIVEADGQPVTEFGDLLAYLVFKNPGAPMELTVVRNGERQQVTVNLGARPQDFGQ